MESSLVAKSWTSQSGHPRARRSRRLSALHVRTELEAQSWPSTPLFVSTESISGPAPIQYTPSNRDGPEPAGGPPGPSAGSLPCLLLTTQPSVPRNKSAIAKKCECLFANLEGLIQRVGIERVGFVTLTFSDDVQDRSVAQGRFNSLATHVLRPRQIEFITVPERQGSGRFHFHLAAAFPWDIRTGFNFDACSHASSLKREHYRNGLWDAGKHVEFKQAQSIYFESANQCLRAWWHEFRELAKRFKFGRCETLPVISNSAAISRYLGAYVSSASDSRLVCDKGMRSVRYSLTRRVASLKFSWVSGNGYNWRRGLECLGAIFGTDFDGLTGLFGNKFQYDMRFAIFALGENFAKAKPLCVQVPEWADHASRMGFLKAVCNSVQKEIRFDDSLLTSAPEQPF